MHFLSYQLPPASELKLGLKKTRAGQQRSSVKRQRKCIFSGFLQLFIAQSPNALHSAKCLVNPLIGSSPTANETDDNFCTTATQLWKKHILFREQLLLARIYFLQKYHAHKAANHLSACLVYQQSANLLKCDVLGVQTLTLKYVWPMCVIVARGHWSVLLACDNDRWNTPTNALGATSHITSHNPLCYGDWPLDTFRCKQLLWCTKAPQFDVLAKMVIWK